MALDGHFQRTGGYGEAKRQVFSFRNCVAACTKRERIRCGAKSSAQSSKGMDAWRGKFGAEAIRSVRCAFVRGSSGPFHGNE